MDQTTLEQLLVDLPLGLIRYFDRIDSTNLEASRLSSNGAPDLSLVVADEQTAGRGRAGRQWLSPPGMGLSFSLISRSIGQVQLISGQEIARFTALGAVAVCGVLQDKYGIDALIKWPNDVLIDENKVAGILAEAHWMDDRPETIVIGVGVNVSPGSVPPDNSISYPATCVEDHLDLSPRDAAGGDLPRLVNRWDLLLELISRMIVWRKKLMRDEFISTWEGKLAYIGEIVQLQVIASPTNPRIGRIKGLGMDGSLALEDGEGNINYVFAGDVSLRRIR